MGFTTGSSCFLQHPFYQFPLPSSQSNFWTRNAQTRWKFIAPMACLHHQDPNEGDFCNKRTVIIMGIAVPPLLGLEARALEEFATKEDDVKAAEDNKKAETVPKTDRQSNPPLSLLNGIGTYVFGVLAALYALVQKAKASADATIETVNSKLKQKDELIVALKRDYESKLVDEQEERTKQLGKANEELQALLNRLNLEKSTTNRLGKELNSQKSFIVELKLQVDSLESKLSKTDADNKDLEETLKERKELIKTLEERINLLNSELKDNEGVTQNLSSSLAAKELELDNLNSSYKLTKDELSHYHLQVQDLKAERLKIQEELEGKESLLNELNARVISLALENNDSRRKLDLMEQEYNEKKVALEAKLFKKTEEELHNLTELLELAQNDASRNEVTIADLKQERGILKESLDNESKNLKDLKYELQITQENLQESRNEVAELEKQLIESNRSLEELELEVSKISAELTDVRESLQRSLDDEKLGTEMLTSELRRAKDQLKKTEKELQCASHEQRAALEIRDSLQRELVDVCKKAETAAENLKEEKKLVASLNKELQALEKQILEDKEARKSLDMDLEEATRALDEMNRNALILSGELVNANSLISDLEKEKEVLYRFLTEQKNASKAAQENIEDAHNLIMKLGSERDNLENRGKKLEEELASAKVEILRLRNLINSSKVVVNNEKQQREEGESNVAILFEKVRCVSSKSSLPKNWVCFQQSLLPDLGTKEAWFDFGQRGISIRVIQGLNVTSLI
ncbi:hypothetical protein L6164_004416 [Bauhinia variegata]|uniref:Uncharacterized protein n=1 Tax=Bauhinia variegata TaxID=167791 RepID=A0ACB9Q6J7_BAUVA|nr:hypothetical protein L6164_004416 [Bauhinia variegata]